MTKPIFTSNEKNLYELNQKLKTKSGLIGTVIGYTEYWNGWVYRLKFPNKNKTLYRKEEVLTPINEEP